MKLWLSKNGEVSIRQQLISQITLAVASGDLAAGERLPSTREIARRFDVHPNTVSAAYRQLAENGVVDQRKGSGVFVATAERDIGDSLHLLIEKLFDDAASQGFSRTETLVRLRELDSAAGRKEVFALFEPDPDLREIITAEIVEATGSPVTAVTLDDIRAKGLRGSHLIAMFDEAEHLSKLLDDDQDRTFLRANSVPGSLADRERPGESDLIAIVSAWDDFLRLSKLFLLAVGVDVGSILVVSTKVSGWKRSLPAASLVICDAITAKEFPDDPRVRPFPVISPSSIDDLRSLTSFGLSDHA